MTTILETAQEVLRLDGLATPGKWFRFYKGKTIDVHCSEKTPIVVWPGFDDCGRSLRKHAANAALIAHYRSAAPALAREVILLAGIVHTLCDQRNCSPDELVTVIEREYQQGNDCADEVIRLAAENARLRAVVDKFACEAEFYSSDFHDDYAAGVMDILAYLARKALTPPEDAA